MKKYLYVLVLIVLPLCVKAAPPALTINEPFYQYQVGISGGFNIAGSPVNGKGFHLGGMIRRGNHTAGFRYEREKDVYNGGIRWIKQYTKIGGYYGFSFAWENFQWGPQIGVGQLEYDYREIAGNSYVNVIIDPDTYFEIAVYGLGGARGNGIGAKIFAQFSSVEKYIGFTLFVQAGYAWNSK